MNTTELTDASTDEIQDVPSYDDINTPVVVMIGVISAVLTLLAMMFVQGLYYHWEDRFRSTPVMTSTEKQEIDKQKKALSAGVITIDEAIGRVVSDFSRR